MTNERNTMNIICRNSGVHYRDIKNPRYKAWMICTDGGRKDPENGKCSYYTGWMGKQIGEYERLKETRNYDADEFTLWLEDKAKAVT